MKKILIFEINRERMNLMADVFMDLLDTSVVKTLRTKEESIIVTKTHRIQIVYFSEERNIEYSQFRAVKADLVINNTMNQSIEMFSSLITIFSKYNKNAVDYDALRE
jgi:sporulation protein YlmC with PRC-barrel domain